MKSLQELAAIRDKMRQTVSTREAAHDAVRVVVGMATCGIAAGARPVLNAFTEEVAAAGLTDVLVTQTGCIGICQYEPVGGGVHARSGQDHLCKDDPGQGQAGRAAAPEGRQPGGGIHHRRGPLRD